MTANRTSGLAITLFALAMIFLVLPVHTEEVGSGWMKPDTLPVACCVALAILGIAQAVRAQGKTNLGPSEAIRFLAAVAIVAGCAWIMGEFGFIPGAIATMAALMPASGERRPLLIVPVAGLVPLGVWLIIVQLLGRSLP